MKKILTVLCLCLGLLFSLNIPALASTDSNIDAKEVLTNYLEAASKQNVDEMVNYVIDSRFSDSVVQKAEYSQSLEEKKIINYKITDMVNVSKTQVKFETVLDFDNGGIENVPFLLEFNKTWKIIINKDSLKEDYEVIKKGTEKPATTLTPAVTLASWNFWDRAAGSTFYSIATFNISGSTATLASLTQTDDYVQQQGCGVTYSIVKANFFGDSVWGTRYVGGEVAIPSNFTITGAGSYTGAQVRFTTDTGSWSTMGYAGTGNLTQP